MNIGLCSTACAAFLMLALSPVAATAAEPAVGALPPGAGLIAPSYWVADLERSKKFYVDGMGLTFASDEVKGPQHEAVFRFDDDPKHTFIILNYTSAPDAPKIQVRDFGKLVVRVPDLDILSARFTAAGFKPNPIQELHDGYRIMTITDPDGRLMQFVQNARPKP